MRYGLVVVPVAGGSSQSKSSPYKGTKRRMNLGDLNSVARFQRRRLRHQLAVQAPGGVHKSFIALAVHTVLAISRHGCRFSELDGRLGDPSLPVISALRQP